MTLCKLLPPLAALTLLAGCAAGTLPSNASYHHRAPDQNIGSLAGPGGLFKGLFGPGGSNHGQTGAAVGVNAFLWRGALDTLSFMPLASADPFGGIIITDWYSAPGAPNERFKATAYILSRRLRANGVKLSLFRQVRQDGSWVDAPVDPGTVAEIENKILDRARQLRVEAAAG
ncbi:MAG: DUF3576 domain-containing protein [Acetobacteraceae bacterium]